MEYTINRYDAVYVRESTARQANEGYNLQGQEEKCTQYLNCMANYGEEVEIKVYREKGFTATTMNRPVFNKLLDDVKQGKIRKVVVQKLDRFGRTMVGVFNMIEEFKKYKTHLVCLRENIDTSLPGWEAVTSIMSYQAQMESSITSERTNEAFKIAASRGSYIKGSYAPFGTVRNVIYEKSEEMCNKENKVIMLKKHQQEWRILLQIYDMANNGINCSQISREIAQLPYMKKSGKTLSDDMINNILNNKIYIGIMKLDGEEYKIRFEGALDEEYWHTVQVNRRHNLKQEEKNEYLYHNKVFCTCGARCLADVTNKYSNSGVLKKYKYYVCPECGKRINQDYITIQIEPKMKKKYKTSITDRMKKTIKERISRVRSLKNDVYRAFVKGVLDNHTYIEEINRINADLDELTIRIQNKMKDYDKVKPKDKKLFFETVIKKIVVNMETKNAVIQW